MKPKLFFEANKTVIDYSKNLSKEKTPTEKLLWSNLRNRNLEFLNLEDNTLLNHIL